MATTLICFLRRTKYPLCEFFSAVQNFEQRKLLIGKLGSEFLLEQYAHDEDSRQLNRAMTIAQFMSHGGSASAQNFPDIVELMTEKEWNFALRHSPYHKKHSALTGLELSLEALKDEVLNLHSLAARMATAGKISGWDSVEYKTAQRQAAGSLLTISSLHSTFIDTSRALRIKQFGKNSGADRAIKRIYRPVEAQHAFLKDLRNCLLHYSIQIPEVTLFLSEDDERYRFFLRVISLLDSGYEWKNPTRSFLSQHDDGEIKVLDVIRNILENIEKQVEFHFRSIARAASNEKLNYDEYRSIRKAVAQRQSDSMVRAFRVHGTWRKRDELRS